jgi:nitrogen fixation NifU-like protein
MMSAAVKGKTTAAARQLISSFKAMMTIHEHVIAGDAADDGESNGSDPAASLSGNELGELAALQGVVKFPVRIKCATLSWNTLAQGLDDIVAGVPSEG